MWFKIPPAGMSIKQLSTEIEFIVGFMLSATVVHDWQRQRDGDIDLEADGETISVKYQMMAAQTGNLSFETELLHTGTGQALPPGRPKLAPGWFNSGSADRYVVVIPDANDPGYLLAYEFEAAKLKAVVTTKAHAERTLSPGVKATNCNRIYDDARSKLVRVSDCADVAKQKRRFRLTEVLRDPRYIAYRATQLKK